MDLVSSQGLGWCHIWKRRKLGLGMLGLGEAEHSTPLGAGCSRKRLAAAQSVRQVRPALPETVHFTYGSDVPVNQSSSNALRGLHQIP